MNAPLLAPAPLAEMECTETELARLHAVFAAQRRAAAADPAPEKAVRAERLRRLLAMTERHGDAIAAAISRDFGHRSRHETELAEIFIVTAAVRHALRHLGRWMKPRRAPTPLHFRPGHSRILRQPLGVVGIISPWNYPYHLSLLPAAAALAAGNRVLLKPSELTPTFSALLQEIVAARFAEDEFAVVTGGSAVGQAFSRQPFDHLFFTGSTAVGRAVAEAAAANLTPVTLELGGKSPAIIDVGADLDLVAPRLAFGKFLNAGQTCVAPDYALVPRRDVEAFVAALSRAIRRMYGTIAENPDYSSIVSERHQRRLLGLLDDARAKGAHAIRLADREGFADAGRKVAPTLLVDVTDDMAVMQEEIFGPLLPILPYDTPDEAIAYVNARPRPLALYWFGDDAARRDAALRRTLSGGVTVNDAVWHVCQEDLPFGGVGASGMGSYHGEHGFLAFAKEKPVFFQSRLNGAGLFHPPYGKTFEQVLGLLKRIV